MKKNKNRLSYCSDIDISNFEGEVWVSCFGYDGRYEVSNFGRVKSVPRIDPLGRLTKERIMKLQNVLKPDRQCTVALCSDGVSIYFQVSRLVLNSFGQFGNDDEEAIHINKFKADNRLENLKFGSHSESLIIGYKTGAHPKPIRNGLAWKEQEKKDYIAKFVTIIDGVIISRVCTTCMTEQSNDQYLYNKFNDVRICKTCHYKHKGIINVGMRQEIAELKAAGLRKCRKCAIIKPLSNFYKVKGNDTMATCKSCYVKPTPKIETPKP